MHEIPLLRDLVVLVAVAIPVVVLAHRLRVPTLVGFLLTGMVIGPHALGFVREVETVNQLAEIGAVLLLFAVGLELSLSRIIRLGGTVLRAGAIQMVGTIAVVAAVALVARLSINNAVLWGALIALSSTAIILKVYADRGELDAPHGRMVVAILLFQDLCVVPLMVLMPLLAGTQQGIGAVARAVVATVVVTGGLVMGARVIVPRILERAASVRSNEIFTLCVLAIGLSAAWLTSIFGLSLALGAFIAGLVVSDSEYGLQALSDVLPFRDTFSGVFFTSVGMLLDVRYFLAHAPLILFVALGVVLLKTAAGYAVVRYVRRSSRVGVIAGVGLAQVGEFSFVLASVAATLGLMGTEEYQVFLGASILTMLAAPFLVNAAPAIADWLLQHRALPTMEFATREVRAAKPLEDHVIIVGYGLNGRNLARALRSAGIAYAILESNGQKVREAKLDREPIFFGDGTRGEVLDRVGIHRARLLVFAIASHQDEKRGIAVSRHMNPRLHIVARTRYVADIEELYTLGANEVVPEEFETSLEIFARVLRRYNVPESRIREQAEEARRDHYELLRQRGTHHTRVDGFLSPVAQRLELESVTVRAGARAVGETRASLGLERATGARAVGIIREGTVRYDVDDETAFRPGDTVVLVGSPEALAAASPLFCNPVEAPAHG
ncbi:MAG TPA: cation:proton antiporter [Gemmatimonadaceae bacterium]|nr:cation:proton antiporter [Gemmatimonadaceae bacterium]